MSKKKDPPKDPTQEDFKKFLESQIKTPDKPKISKKATFLAQCNCTTKFYDRSTYEEFKEIHEKTAGHEFKVISP